MPKISEATVAEHRAAQHSAVLSAAERLIVANDGHVPTIAEVAAEVGLARSSVYQYVTSRKDLVIQLNLMAIEKWTVALSSLVSNTADNPGDRIAAYVDAALRLFVSGSHGPLVAAAQQYPEAFSDERVQKAHSAMEPTLHKLLGDVSLFSLPLIDAAIQRGADMVTHSGADLVEVSAALQRMARAGLE